MINNFTELAGLQLDALREIGNIGAGNAATALAQMTNSKIDMSVPRVSILPFSDVSRLMGGAENVVAGVYLRATGSAQINILFVLSVESARFLVDMLMGGPSGQIRDFGEMEASALKEVGNIISGAYLNALAGFTALTFIPSVPALGMDMAGAILDAVLAQFGEVGDHVLILETEFKKDGRQVIGNFLVLPEPGALDIILTALGVTS